MGAVTKIQWTTHTFNPWRGCVKVSPGCKFCYAEKQALRNPAVLGIWGPQGTRVVASEKQWADVMKWQRVAAAAGEKHKVFCCSMADVFEDWKGQVQASNGVGMWRRDDGTWTTSDHYRDTVALSLQDVRDRLFDLVYETPNLIWQFLTKRPENMARMVPASWEETGWPDNVWAMTSVENQEMADERIQHLLRLKAKVRGLSVEPLLESVQLFDPRPWCRHHQCFEQQTCWNEDKPCFRWQANTSDMIDWVIIGGESGGHARECRVEWVRDLIRQCKKAGVACFVKQLGENVMMDGLHFKPETCKAGEPNEWPEDLRVREFPGDA